MLYAISALQGYTIEASDGPIGTVKDVLFDDRSWKLRWLVVETGSWLLERRVLLHPLAVKHADHDRQLLVVNLTKAQVEGSLGIAQDLPVSQQIEQNLYSYYGWDPMWGGVSYFDAGAMALPVVMPILSENMGEFRVHPQVGAAHKGVDPHLRSIHEIIGYNLQATDGNIGHVENFLFDDANWSLRYLIVDTKNWWPGQHVLLSPYAIAKIDWPANQINLDVTREKVKSGPKWDPAAVTSRAYEQQLHLHYGWRGYGW